MAKSYSYAAALNVWHAIKGSEYAAKKGEKLTAHYTEEAGNNLAHFIKHI